MAGCCAVSPPYLYLWDAEQSGGLLGPNPLVSTHDRWSENYPRSVLLNNGKETVSSVKLNMYVFCSCEAQIVGPLHELFECLAT